MKPTKTLILLALTLTLTTATRGQEVFNQVVNRAKDVIDDPRADAFLLSLSQFKYTAMQYLCTTAIKRNGGGVDADFLDRQAYAMNHFVTSYLAEVARLQNAPNSQQKDTQKRYWRASAENPLFGDSDKEKTEAFLNDPECITPFSLDTDWERADQAISGAQ